MGNEGAVTLDSTESFNSYQGQCSCALTTLHGTPDPLLAPDRTPQTQLSLYKRLVHNVYNYKYTGLQSKFLLGTATCCLANIAKDLYVGINNTGFSQISALSALIPNLSGFGICTLVATRALKNTERSETIAERLNKRFIDTNVASERRAKQIEILQSSKKIGSSDAMCNGLATLGLAFGLNALKDVASAYMQQDQGLRTCSIINACLNTSGLLVIIGAGVTTLHENHRKSERFKELLKELDQLIIAEQELA